MIKGKLLAGSRNLVQLIIFIITVAVGFQFYIFVSQALGDSPITVPRPSGVEGFLPIGALMGWKYFINTGHWDIIHPAAMVFLGFAVFISFLLRKSFCGWFCPVGTFSEWIWKTGEYVLKKNFKIPLGIDIPLRLSKYLLLGFFIYIVFKMSSSDIAAFLQSPYYKIADVKMLHFFTEISYFTSAVLLSLILLSFLYRNFWCRYACPYGALLGIFGMFSPTRIHRNPDTCINCEKCTQVCPFHLPVNKKKQIFSPECNCCLDCVNTCPSEETLELKTVFFKNSLKTSHVGFCVILIFTVIVYCSEISGHWKSGLSESEFKTWLKLSDSSINTDP
ncbi:MAG: 4Fe-4S binding protein [Proteobacteria bacterium]|nr:4Fe-4S binding protein [Pseudomonadota bacterium]